MSGMMTEHPSPPVIQNPTRPGRTAGALRLWPHLAALLLLAAETAWAAPWFHLVAGQGVDAPVLAAYLFFTASAALAYVLTAALDAWQIKEGVLRGALTALLILALAAGTNWLLAGAGGWFSNPAVLWLAAVLLWLLWRAVTLARSSAGPLVAWGRVRQGLLALVAYIFVFWQVQGESPGYVPLILYLFFGLLGMVFARIAGSSMLHGVRSSPFSRAWLLTTLGSVLVSVLLAVFAGSLVTGMLAALLGQTSNVIVAALRALLFIVGIPFLLLAYLISPLISGLDFRFEGLQPEGEIRPEVEQPALEELLEGADLAPPALLNIPSWVFAAVFWGIVLVVVLLLARRTQRRLRRRREIAVETEWLAPEGGLFARLRDRAAEAAALLAGRFGAGRLLAAARIRRIFARLMQLAAELGAPRPQAQTPLEYLPALEALFPDHAAELRLITDAYLRVRYGEVPETEAEVTAIDGAWERVAAAGRQLKTRGAG